ncbi:MAG: hypothetical protein KJ065_19270 [Anaerolineae bacterium]|nr:hypothetical protein [Anaerolineae bacterium]
MSVATPLIPKVFDVIFTSVASFTRRYLRYGMPALLATTDGHYVQIDENNQLRARTTQKAEAAHFVIRAVDRPYEPDLGGIIRYGDSVTLCFEDTRFVSATMAEEHWQLRLRSHSRSWEAFRLVQLPPHLRRNRDTFLRYGSLFALIAHTGKTVGHDRNNGYRFFATVDHIEDWEILIFVKP